MAKYNVGKEKKKVSKPYDDEEEAESTPPVEEKKVMPPLPLPPPQEDLSKLYFIKKDKDYQALLISWPLLKVGIEGDFCYDDWCALAGLPPAKCTLEKAEWLFQMKLVLPGGKFAPIAQAFVEALTRHVR